LLTRYSPRPGRSRQTWSGTAGWHDAALLHGLPRGCEEGPSSDRHRACEDQSAGSPFLQKLNPIGDVVQEWVANALAVRNGPADPAFQPSCL
jgi:hypothetical protein